MDTLLDTDVKPTNTYGKPRRTNRNNAGNIQRAGKFFPQALLDGFSFGAGEQKGFPVGKIVFGPEISTNLPTNVMAPNK